MIKQEVNRNDNITRPGSFIDVVVVVIDPGVVAERVALARGWSLMKHSERKSAT